jgi:hypothetical protein
VKVRMLRNPAASYGCRVAEGETGEVPDNLGRQLVSQGLAECLDPPPAAEPEPPPPEPAPVVRAIPEPPAIAEAKATEIKPERKTYQPVKRPPVVQVPNRKPKET